MTIHGPSLKTSTAPSQTHATTSKGIVMSHYDYRDHKTPHGIVEEEYDGYFIYNFILYRPKDQTEPLSNTLKNGVKWILC